MLPVEAHAALMQRALAEAARAQGRTHPNPMVGCVIARGGRIIAVGHHVRAGEPHAEVVALRRAGAAARGADAYVTLEPCNHIGRTGRCTEALIAAGIARVFVGMRDPNPIVHGRGVRRLRAAGIEVHTGLLGQACRQLNEAYCHAVVAQRPFVLAKVAQSLDGRVATHTGQAKWVTGKAARAAGHALRNIYDGIVVGVGTVLADDPALTCRVRGGRDPERIIIDTSARTPPEAQVLRLGESKAATWIVVGATRASQQRCGALARAGARVLRCAEAPESGRVDLRAALELLAQQGLSALLVEGGPTLLGSFFDAALVNKVAFFVAPMIIGGEQALSSVGGQGAATLAGAPRLLRTRWEEVGGDWMLTGYPQSAAPAP